MEVSIIKIGNSKGFRLSKTLIEKYNIKDKVEIILEKGYMIIKPIAKPRTNWDKAFKEMNENGDDQLLFNDVFEDEKLLYLLEIRNYKFKGDLSPFEIEKEKIKSLILNRKKIKYLDQLENDLIINAKALKKIKIKNK